MNIIYVEDSESHKKLFMTFFKKNHYKVTHYYSAKEAFKRIKSSYKSIDLIISDWKLPDMNGYDFMKKVKKEINPEIRFIMISGHGDIELAVKAMKAKATDFISKPVIMIDLLNKIKKIEENIYTESVIDKIKDKTNVNTLPDFEGIISKSEIFRKELAKVLKVANHDIPIIIFGETGTGKELIANLVCKLSNRRNKPFVVVNTASIPENLFESHFFGHEKGAFTGADNKKIGFIELTNGGTLFLDEISELPYNMQSKLLRFLQNSEITRLGNSKSIKVDVRVICATNKDLNILITEKKFRQDLYFRLNGITVTLPPLRERKEDIPYLIEHFLDKYSLTNEEKVLSSLAKDKLMRYNYPGNVRELEKLIQCAIILSRRKVIDVEDIPHINSNKKIANIDNSLSLFQLLLDENDKVKKSFDDIKKDIIQEAYEYFDNDISRMKNAFGVNKSTVYRWLEKCGIDFKK